MTAKVDLCLFTYRAVSPTALLHINQMVEWSEKQGVDVQRWEYGNALIHQARNAALAQTRKDATHVLMCDDDMMPPASALVRLLNCGRPVVSAACTTRGRPVRLAAKVYDKAKDLFGVLESVNIARPVEGPFAPGTGFLLLERGVVDQLLEYHLSGQDWLDENRTMLSRLHVRSELREREKERLSKVRRELYQKQQYHRLFSHAVTDSGLETGEDICLGWKLLQLGIPVTIDGTTPVGHLGEYAYSIADMLTEAA